MNNSRMFLYAALGLIVFMLYSAWQTEHPRAAVVASSATTVPATTAGALPPAAVVNAALGQTSASGTTATTGTTLPAVGQTPTTAGLIQVKTDVLQVAINPRGGNIVDVKLPTYPQSVTAKEVPVTLLSSDPTKYYVAQSGWVDAQGQASLPLYQAAQTHYELTPTQNNLILTLTARTAKGLQITKTFTFTRGKFSIAVNYQLQNMSGAPWQGHLYAQMQRNKPVAQKTGFMQFHTFQGAAMSTPADAYQKISYEKLQKEDVNTSAQGGWLSFQELYFLGAWIPDQQQQNHYYSRYANDIYTLGLVGPLVTLAPGQTLSTGLTLYTGPELQSQLQALAPHLDLTIDYGFLWIISAAIFWVMAHIYSVVGNWGVAIILVTLLIKLLFYQLSAKSARSMARMRDLAPRIEILRERYADDKQKLSQAMMELYRKEKVNPVSGCLPMLVQIPFFFALYYVLIESVQLRQAPFVLWIKDLSIHDPYFVLPILMGISMFLQQRLNPAPPDPMQAKMMMLLPVVFTIFFLYFPAGLVLYWLVNNVASALQQWYVMKTMVKTK